MFGVGLIELVILGVVLIGGLVGGIIFMFFVLNRPKN